jgi:hypothetical protein
VIENILSKELFGRTETEEKQFDQAYRQYLEKTGKVRVVLSSNFLNPHNKFTSRLLNLSRKISIKSFSHLLPEEKRPNLLNLNGKEILHALIHLLNLEYLSQNSQTLLTGQNTRAILAAHRSIVKKTPLSALFMPFFTSQVEVSNSRLLLKRLIKKS